MAREAGSSQGFGRVSPDTRPSPYSPLHFRGSVSATAADEKASASRKTSGKQARRRGLGRRTVVVVVVLAAMVAGIGYVAVSRSPAAPTRAVVVPGQPVAKVTLDDEGSRRARAANGAARH